MEKEFTDPAPYYYSGGGQFYSPQLVRSLSEAGQTSSSGPGGGSGGGSGFGGQSAGQSAGNGSGGFSPNFSPSLQQGAEAYGVFVGANAAVQGITALIAYLTAGEVVLGPPGWIAAAASGLFVLFDDLFGGGGSSPQIPRQLRHGRHPLYPVMLGVPNGLIPTEASAGLEICGLNVRGQATNLRRPSVFFPTPPLQKPEGNLVQIGVQEPQVVLMRPGQQIIVNNPGGSAAFEITCQRDGTLVVEDFNNGAEYRPFGATFTVSVMGVQTTYICRGNQLSYD
jgi:hypothetical protein